jgi:hypothetical protein
MKGIIQRGETRVTNPSGGRQGRVAHTRAVGKGAIC